VGLDKKLFSHRIALILVVGWNFGPEIIPVMTTRG
jgi:hypothetical protein